MQKKEISENRNGVCNVISSLVKWGSSCWVVRNHEAWGGGVSPSSADPPTFLTSHRCGGAHLLILDLYDPDALMHGLVDGECMAWKM